MKEYDIIIIGAGLYGLYSALSVGEKGKRVLVLEKEDSAFKRATYVNQARVHLGYHYPRSLSTAKKSANYFNLFNDKYGFCVKKDFDQIYATSANFSWTNAKEFEKFCKNTKIPCKKLNPDDYFKDGMCDGTFLTQEYTFDAFVLRDYFLKEISLHDNIEIVYNSEIENIEKKDSVYSISLKDKQIYETPFLLSATYASVNQILNMLNFEPFKIKYELCEIILCKVNDKLKNIGLTVMDGPFFSIMPFGLTNYHSLTSVTFTPHTTSYEKLPTFKCQLKSNGYCSPSCLGNCNQCPAKPESAWPYMSRLAKKYMKDEFQFEYVDSLFSIKPILMATEIDDSRPTVIRKYSENPTFVTVLSGKINTVFDLEEELKNV